MPKGKARKRIALAEAQGWRCAYCAGVMEIQGEGPQVATIEHVIARCRGGSEAWDNLVAACLGCNGGRDFHRSATRFLRVRRLLLAQGLWPQCEHPNRAIAKWLRGFVEPSSGAQVMRFRYEEVLTHIERHHPGCPESLRQELARDVADRAWGGVAMGIAFGIAATEKIREVFTDYRRLRQVPGMRKFEARVIVRQEVSDVFRRWRASTAADIQGSRRAGDAEVTGGRPPRHPGRPFVGTT